MPVKRGEGHLLDGGASPLFVLNADSKTATSAPKDPYGTRLSSDTKVVVIKNPGRNYLQLAHLTTGTEPTTSPIVSLFGNAGHNAWKRLTDARRAPAEGVTDFLLPSDFTTSFDKPDHVSMNGDQWVPLYNPVTGLSLITWALPGTTAAEIAKVANTGTAFFLYHQRQYVYCSGMDEILCTVSTAAAGPTAGMIVGWFS